MRILAFVDNDFSDASYIQISDASEFPFVNGLWKKNGENAGKPIFEHCKENLFLYADAGDCCKGNWHITNGIESGDTYYWAPKSDMLYTDQDFYTAGFLSALKIRLGKGSGKLKNFENNVKIVR